MLKITDEVFSYYVNNSTVLEESWTNYLNGLYYTDRQKYYTEMMADLDSFWEHVQVAYESEQWATV
jgi:hypothetical protein